MYIYMYSVPSGYSTYTYTKLIIWAAWALIINTQTICMDAAALAFTPGNLLRIWVLIQEWTALFPCKL